MGNYRGNTADVQMRARILALNGYSIMEIHKELMEDYLSIDGLTLRQMAQDAYQFANPSKGTNDN